MRVPRKFLLGPVLFAAVCVASWASHFSEKDAPLRVEIGEDIYVIPKVYGASGGLHKPTGINDLSIQFKKSDMGPILKNYPGWDDNVNLLLSDFSFPVAQLYDNMWDGDLYPGIAPSKSTDIIRTEKINDNLLYQEMGGHIDVILVTDNKGEFDGFMQCDKYEMAGSANGCQFLFNQGGKRWQISFGKQFIEDYQKIRKDVIDRMDSFKINPKQ